ncbi:MAG: pilus assembly protein PilM [Desulfovibrionales bacterium]
MAEKKSPQKTSFLTETILAVDLGSKSIKLARMRRSFKSMQVDALIQAPTSPDASPSDSARLVRELIDANGLQSQRVIVGVSGAAAVFRQMTFPFSKRDKIAQVLPFELGSLVPVEMDSLSIDFVPMLSQEQGKHRILASGLSREIVREWIQAFAAEQLHPEIIDIDLMGPWLLSRHFSPPVPDHYCLADIGWSGMRLVFVSKGELVDVRVIPLGLRDLVRQVAAGGSGSPAPTEETLSQWDFNPVGDDQRSEPARKKVAEIIKAMGSEIAMATFSLQAQHPEIEWEQILVCGGGALVPGLNAALEVQLNTVVRPVSDLALPLQGFADHPEAALFGPAVGLATQAASPRQGMNFRKGDLARVNTLGGKKELLAAAAVLLILLVGGAIVLGLEASVKNRRLTALEQQVESVFNRTAPDFQGNVRPSQYPSILKSRIMAVGGGTGMEDSPAGSPLEILLGISQAISGGLKLVVSDITIDPGSVRLSGTAEAFNTVNEAQKRFSTLDTVSEVKILGAKAGTGGNNINFSMQLIRKGGTRS